QARPGEVSLAHKGVLFLDELPEFSRPVLESLRQPLESGSITVARANHHVTYPARFQLIAAMNPCKCGYLDNPLLACSKAPRCARDYQGRISGPMFDRIDLHIDVPALAPQEMTQPSAGESRAVIAGRVARAREVQAERFAKSEKSGLRTNAEAEGELLDKIAVLDAKGRELLLRATERLHLTARGYHRVLRVARTIADLDGKDSIARSHIGEAISFRRIALERKGQGQLAHG
ncbi:MAG: ATP-binding protein, partial [Geminicoccaceae bacterium]